MEWNYTNLRTVPLLLEQLSETAAIWVKKRRKSGRTGSSSARGTPPHLQDNRLFFSISTGGLDAVGHPLSQRSALLQSQALSGDPAVPEACLELSHAGMYSLRTTYCCQGTSQWIILSPASGTPHQDAPPQYYSSRQTLVASPYQEQPVETAHDRSAQRPEHLFMVGLPNTYRLPSLELPLPRLPSYESVRKRDRQRYIHMLIAHRFGLYGSTLTEPPPTYEESIRQSVEVNWENLEPPVHSHLDRDATTSSQSVP
ncbi:uncharacterized protein [Paramormyrops kingsleyae]|uniref:uncharacterized protein isoform X2 n=1 Tax=Paramormyrops kingsleyae TaxID=1676925 RepID=UPI000CD608CB|nr:uncharacterized protein LOC111856729 isoform X2 [Paramormyrops kingsleyae]